MFGFFKEKIEDFKQTVSNTAKSLVGNVLANVDSGEEEYSDFALDDIEDTLISADLGVSYSAELVDNLRSKKGAKPSELKNYLKEEFKKTLNEAGSTELNFKDGELNIYFITGVNGAGKTTLIAKLAYKFKQEGKKVLVAAGDTFRAAAEEQLNIWSVRAGADIVRRAMAKKKKKVMDEEFNLMEELKKIKTVIDKQAPESLRESILVLDANTGQNGLQQAKVFGECVNLTCAALTKLDGSAKGAIILAIAKEMKLPVKLVGVGEKMEDVKPFNADDFIEALFE